MPNDAAPTDPLEDLLAEWFAGAMLAADPQPGAEDESAYAAELDRLADTRVRARALARVQCLRLFARLERRAVEGRYGSAIAPRRSVARAAELGGRRDSPRFELSI
jgi:hypothetical protein